jgi:CHAT domain
VKTQVITMDAAVNGSCAVNVYFDDGTPNWRTLAKASGAIDTALTKQPHPKDAAGNPLAPSGIVKFLHDQDRPNQTTFAAIGEHLWSLLDQGAVGTFFATTWKAHAKTNALDVKEGIRTILDVRDPDLQALPWELMLRQNVPLFASPQNPFVRGPLEPEPTAQVGGLVLRVLVVIGSAPGDPAVKAEEEIQNLEDAARIFRREVDLRIEYPHSLNDLSDLIKTFQPHVLHFTGHGGEVPRPGKEPIASLVFHDDTGGIWDWTAAEVAATLAVGAPRLAFLNACRTGAGVDPNKIVSALSAEFLKVGTAAVVAMQADIAGAAAAEFAGATYAALANGQPLDGALADARYAVRQRTKAATRDWCLPSLTVGVDVTQVLPSRLQITQQHRLRLEATPEFVEIQAFVDRRPERRCVDPMAVPDATEEILIVKGAPLTGKSAMLKWFLEGCAWCGHAVKYVNLRRDPPKEHERANEPRFPVINWILLKDSSPSDLRQQMPGDFSRILQLNLQLKNGAAGQAGAAGTPDDPIETLFTAVRAALVNAAQGKPLIIALDHVGDLDAEEFRTYIRPKLLEPVAQHHVQPVRVVLTCTDVEYRDLALSRLDPARIVNIDNFAAKEFSTLVSEFLLYKKIPRQQLPPPPQIPLGETFPPSLLTGWYELLRLTGKIG